MTPVPTLHNQLPQKRANPPGFALFAWLQISSQLGLQQRLELLLVPGELTNTLGQFLGRHRIFVVHPAKGFLVQCDVTRVAGRSRLRRQTTRHVALGGCKPGEQIRADRKVKVA